MRFTKLLLAGVGASLALAGIPGAAMAQQPVTYSPSVQVNLGNAQGTTDRDSVAGFDFNSGTPAAQQSLTITRGSTVFTSPPTDPNSDGGSFIQITVQPGDVIRYIEAGVTRQTVTYDGTPTVNAGGCGTTTISGKQLAGAMLFGTVSGTTTYKRTQLIKFTSTGATFTGTLKSPLVAGDAVRINQTTNQGGGAYNSSLTVIPCAAATPTGGGGGGTTTTTTTNNGTTNNTTTTTVPLITPILPLLGKVTFLSGSHLLKTFFSTGITELVTLNGPGTVFADLFEANGKIPAQASAKKKKKKKKGATLLGRTQVTALHAGTVKVTIKPNKAARKLKKKKKLRVALTTTVRNSVGVNTALPAQHLTLKK